MTPLQISAVAELGRTQVAGDLAGKWQARLWRGEQVMRALSEKGEFVTLAAN